MKKNDGSKDNEGDHRLTRRAALKAGLALGALVSRESCCLRCTAGQRSSKRFGEGRTGKNGDPV